MSGKRDEGGEYESEGREALEEESVGSLAPNPELEAALREATASVEARRSAREVPRGQSEVQELRERLAQAEERLLRLGADFDNLRKRTLKEREDAHRYGHENLVKDLLATVDDLERAIGHARSSDGGDFESMLQGVELVQRQLLAVLGKHGVTPIAAQGEPFDPAVHEAMAQAEDASVPPSTVVQVFQTGYRLRDRLLRPARVVVSKGPGPGEPKGDPGEEEGEAGS